MIKRKQVTVFAVKKNGNKGSIDVLDLDDESFRAFVLSVLVKNGMIASVKPEILPGNELELHENVDVRPIPYDRACPKN